MLKTVSYKAVSNFVFKKTNLCFLIEFCVFLIFYTYISTYFCT